MVGKKGSHHGGGALFQENAWEGRSDPARRCPGRCAGRGAPLLKSNSLPAARGVTVSHGGAFPTVRLLPRGTVTGPSPHPPRSLPLYPPGHDPSLPPRSSASLGSGPLAPLLRTLTVEGGGPAAWGTWPASVVLVTSGQGPSPWGGGGVSSLCAGPAVGRLRFDLRATSGPRPVVLGRHWVTATLVCLSCAATVLPSVVAAPRPHGPQGLRCPSSGPDGPGLQSPAAASPRRRSCPTPADLLIRFSSLQSFQGSQGRAYLFNAV